MARGKEPSILLRPEQAAARHARHAELAGKRTQCTVDILSKDGLTVTRQRIFTDTGDFQLPVPVNTLEEMEMARDVRGAYVDEMGDFIWFADHPKTLEQWLASTNWLGFTNRQVWGVSLIRALEMLKDSMPKEQGTGKPNTSKPISLSLFCHPELDECNKCGFESTPIYSVRFCPDGAIMVVKCWKHHTNNTTECPSVGIAILPICTNPLCANIHAPITAANNAVPATEVLKNAVKARCMNGDKSGLWCPIKAWCAPKHPLGSLPIPEGSEMPWVYPTLTGLDDPTAAPGDGLLPPFVAELPVDLEDVCSRERETFTRTERALVDGYLGALQTIDALQQNAPNALDAGASQLKNERDQARQQAATFQVNLNDVTAERDVARLANAQIQGELNTAKTRIRWLVQRQVGHLVTQTDS